LSRKKKSVQEPSGLKTGFGLCRAEPQAVAHTSEFAVADQPQFYRVVSL
jgi:hypothetical protein